MKPDRALLRSRALSRFDENLRARLAELESASLLRTPLEVRGATAPRIDVDGRPVLAFSSNDYLSLAGHPALRAALAEGARVWGAGAGASRLISGTQSPHREAERQLAAHVGLPRALLFGSGYAANVGTTQALVGREDVVLSDELNHASLIDGCRLSRARVLVYRHADVDHVASLLAEHRRHHRSALIVTDALFSMDGDLAPLADLRALADLHGAGLLVDEAHTVGVLGEGGRGACAQLGVRPDALVGTLGKALGLAGAFVAGSAELVRWVENRARSFVFSTAMPPAIAFAVPGALELARAADEGRARLLRHASAIRAVAARVGAPAPRAEGPIVPLIIGDPAATMAVSRALLERGFHVQGIRPPTVPPGTSRLRIVPQAGHTDADVDALVSALADTLSHD